MMRRRHGDENFLVYKIAPHEKFLFFEKWLVWTHQFFQVAHFACALEIQDQVEKIILDKNFTMDVPRTVYRKFTKKVLESQELVFKLSFIKMDDMNSYSRLFL